MRAVSASPQVPRRQLDDDAGARGGTLGVQGGARQRRRPRCPHVQPGPVVATHEHGPLPVAVGLTEDLGQCDTVLELHHAATVAAVHRRQQGARLCVGAPRAERRLPADPTTARWARVSTLLTTVGRPPSPRSVILRCLSAGRAARPASAASTAVSSPATNPGLAATTCTRGSDPAPAVARQPPRGARRRCPRGRRRSCGGPRSRPRRARARRAPGAARGATACGPCHSTARPRRRSRRAPASATATPRPPPRACATAGTRRRHVRSDRRRGRRRG